MIGNTEQKLQRQFEEHEPFFCDINGPGGRSSSIPLSVHRLTPGDIDIVGVSNFLPLKNSIFKKFCVYIRM